MKMMRKKNRKKMSNLHLQASGQVNKKLRKKSKKNLMMNKQISKPLMKTLIGQQSQFKKKRKIKLLISMKCLLSELVMKENKEKVTIMMIYRSQLLKIEILMICPFLLFKKDHLSKILMISQLVGPVSKHINLWRFKKVFHQLVLGNLWLDPWQKVLLKMRSTISRK